MASDSEKKSAFRRAIGRKKVVKVVAEEKDENNRKLSPKLGRTQQLRASSRKRNLCKKLAGSKGEPIFGSRAKTGLSTLNAKERVLEQYPGLKLESPKNKADEIVFQGPNSIRAEVIDFNAMLIVMQDNMKMLTHTAVERFFEWMPIFSIYIERYIVVEEDFIMKWIEKKSETLRGDLRPSHRMVLRGKIQRQIQDIQDIQDEFMPHLPAGERLPRLVEAVKTFTRHIEEYLKVISTKLPEVISKHYEKAEIDKAKIRIVKHLVAHVGYQDFLAIYTRWMRRGQLLEWKTTVLFPCDFKFFSYGTWDKDMDYAHYQIASQFAEALEEENAEEVELNKQSKVDFERALANRQEAEGLEEDFDANEIEYGDAVQPEDDCEKPPPEAEKK